MALNTKLFCPGCGRFLLRVEQTVALEMSCHFCKQDIKFVRQPVEVQIRGRRGNLRPPMIVWFPDKIDEAAGGQTETREPSAGRVASA